VTSERRVPQYGHRRDPWPLPSPTPFGCPTYLFLSPRALDELMRAESRAALELARSMEVPRENH
jgi:hypothetical protein